MKRKKAFESKKQYYMCVGIAIGTALGVVTDNLAIYMPLGLAVGMCIGASLDDKNHKKAEDTSGEKED